MKPLLGPPAEEWTGGLCRYAPKPGDMHCLRAAAWHGMVTTQLDPDGAIPSLECCDGHLPQMRLTADYVHPLEHSCTVPGAEFREAENRCVIEWDEAAEFAAEAAVAGIR